MEELSEVLGDVKEIEDALQKCCDIARLAIEKYDDLFSSHQKMLIELDDSKQTNVILED